MINLLVTQKAVLAADHLVATWLFDIQQADGTRIHASTKDVYDFADALEWEDGLAWEVGITWEGAVEHANGLDWEAGLEWEPGLMWEIGEANLRYAFQVVDFEGVTIRRPAPELMFVPPTEISFALLDEDASYSAADFVGGQVWLTLSVEAPLLDRSAIIGRWRFNIVSASSAYRRVEISCEDYFSRYLQGVYPATPLVDDLAPTDVSGTGGAASVPVPFGTAYVPLRPIHGRRQPPLPARAGLGGRRSGDLRREPNPQPPRPGRKTGIRVGVLRLRAVDRHPRRRGLARAQAHRLRRGQRRRPGSRGPVGHRQRVLRRAGPVLTLGPRRHHQPGRCDPAGPARLRHRRRRHRRRFLRGGRGRVLRLGPRMERCVHNPPATGARSWPSCCASAMRPSTWKSASSCTPCRKRR